MRLALISDIHGNITGLKAVLAQVRKMGGADALYALGDHIGFGAATDEVLDLLSDFIVKDTQDAFLPGKKAKKPERGLYGRSRKKTK